MRTRTCPLAIKRFEGYIAQYLGDGVLAYFGYPRANEDDAERAVRAALDIQESLAALPRDQVSLASPIEARIGIHSGPVLMSDVGNDGADKALRASATRSAWL